jgi:hypothetical protein
MDDYVMGFLVSARRTREAVRTIRQFDVDPMTKKYTLAAWFREHTRAAPSAEAKRQAYDNLIGAEVNKASRG